MGIVVLILAIVINTWNKPNGELKKMTAIVESIIENLGFEILNSSLFTFILYFHLFLGSKTQVEEATKVASERSCQKNVCSYF